MLDKVKNVYIRSRLGQVAVVSRVENKKTEWLKKMEEMTDDRMVKKVYIENVLGNNRGEDQGKDGLMI